MLIGETQSRVLPRYQSMNKFVIINLLKYLLTVFFLKKTLSYCQTVQVGQVIITKRTYSYYSGAHNNREF